MPDIIQLLPDSIANQIAAGEVIQRPASVVKELLENSLDAGSQSITLIIKDSGKTSIQVVDDGKGMSETDARMSFERHATSKISQAQDLFHIRTMGFRGEALASIAAIAHIEMISRLHDKDLGHKIVVRGSKIEKSEATQTMPGTSISVRNLFYNVPARRKFLKSDAVELRHITEEFTRVSLANPDIAFVMYHNDNEMYRLPKASLKHRILHLFGKNLNDKLVPVNEETEVANITGYIGKPETARKTRGNQYIFVNNRFIISNYLNHAIRTAYEKLIPAEQYPTYFIFLEVDPANIDINVHPTKTEIKFEDERLIYNYLRVSLKHSLGQYSVSPSLDFGTDTNFVEKHSRTDNRQSTGFTTGDNSSYKPQKVNAAGWDEIYKGLGKFEVPTELDSSPDARIIEKEAFSLDENTESKGLINTDKKPWHFGLQYIIREVPTGMMVIDQQAAHERILYEKFLKVLKSAKPASQKELFPRTIQLDPGRSEVLKSILTKINSLGFEMEDFGHHSYIVHGTPAGLDSGTNLNEWIEELIQSYIDNIEFKLDIDENLARSIAVSSAIKRNKRLETEEMNLIIKGLFECEMPNISPSGKKCFLIIKHEEFTKRFTL